MTYYVVLARHYTDFFVVNGNIGIESDECSRAIVVGVATSEISAEITATMYLEQHEVNEEREDNLGGPISEISLHEVGQGFGPKLQPGKFLRRFYPKNKTDAA
jgi:hypothetical protein